MLCFSIPTSVVPSPSLSFTHQLVYHVFIHSKLSFPRVSSLPIRECGQQSVSLLVISTKFASTKTLSLLRKLYQENLFSLSLSHFVYYHQRQQSHPSEHHPSCGDRILLIVSPSLYHPLSLSLTSISFYQFVYFWNIYHPHHFLPNLATHSYALFHHSLSLSPCTGTHLVTSCDSYVC